MEFAIHFGYLIILFSTIIYYEFIHNNIYYIISDMYTKIFLNKFGNFTLIKNIKINGCYQIIVKNINIICKNNRLNNTTTIIGLPYSPELAGLKEITITVKKFDIIIKTHTYYDNEVINLEELIIEKEEKTELLQACD